LCAPLPTYIYSAFRRYPQFPCSGIFRLPRSVP
jgi:hypothetical protein